MDSANVEARRTVAARTAAEAGWHVSRYNVSARIPGTNRTAIANLLRGTCAEFSELECYLLSVLDELDEHHPFIARFVRRGVIANHDELAEIEAMARMACAYASGVSLTICPTMGCNFDCPYCFEDHRPGMMSHRVQDDVVALAGRLLEVSGGKTLHVTWFGGEPLLATHIIESLSSRLMAIAKRHGAVYEAEIVTNGYLLTPKVARMLGEVGVTRAQITLDGVGATHDATRHLVDGRPTFHRIVQNISQPGLPFEVLVRHNVHEGNLGEMGRVRALVEKVAKKSGNCVQSRVSVISDNTAAAKRHSPVDTVGLEARRELMVGHVAKKFSRGRGHYCGAHVLWNICIDEQGNLHKCWEAVDKPHLSFGNACDWDPADPLATATNPNTLSAYLNSTGVTVDAECRECVWLPVCRGGCPYQRLFAGGRRCFAYRDDPDSYVLALYARIGNRGRDQA